MNKQPDKTAQTKFILSTAFWELFKKKPITKITVKNITDRAGFYRSTFYLYFTDVYDVLDQIEDNILHDWEIMIKEVWEQGKQAMMFEMVTTFFKQNGEYMCVLLSPKGDPSFQQKIKSIMRPKMFSHFKLSEKNAKGSMIFEFLISAMLAFCAEWYRNSKYVSAEDAVALLQSLSSESIASVILKQRIFMN